MKAKKLSFIILFLLGFIAALIGLIYFTLPINRVGIHSELIMLGDLDNNHVWDNLDQQILQNFLMAPFSFSKMDAVKVDINRNGLLDGEDIEILNQLYTYSDPYIAEAKAFENKQVFPRPRELFIYVPKSVYIKRSLFTLKHDIVPKSVFTFLKDIKPDAESSSYTDQILLEIYNEALRASLAYEKRKSTLNEIEEKYADQKIRYCNQLYEKGEYYNLLLNLIGLVEDAETLTMSGQSKFIRSILYFRDDLKALLKSDFYKEYLQGKASYAQLLEKIDLLIQKDLSMNIKLEKLPPPRNVLKLSNYIERAEWQKYKSSSKLPEFEQLLLYAQYDPRYLRAVAKTSRKYEDVTVENHNLPIILLFREALRIKFGDKKAAVGLLDETIRVPFTWIKTIPKENLPSSIALENFLLPGNKEDGSDKSRHWNVFGGICLYKSPEESLLLALSREMNDLRDDKFTSYSMTEFLRDTIANINGIYYVVSINPHLVYAENQIE